jgi:hypothetical protein
LPLGNKSGSIRFDFPCLLDVRFRTPFQQEPEPRMQFFDGAAPPASESVRENLRQTLDNAARVFILGLNPPPTRDCTGDIARIWEGST